MDFQVEMCREELENLVRIKAMELTKDAMTSLNASLGWHMRREYPQLLLPTTSRIVDAIMSQYDIQLIRR